MPNAIKKLKQDEKKSVLAYAQLKLKANRLNKELDTLKQNVVNVFDGNNFGLQKINRKRKNFDKENFKVKHNDLFNEYQKVIEYQEYKAIGGIDGLNYKEMS